MNDRQSRFLMVVILGILVFGVATRTMDWAGTWFSGFEGQGTQLVRYDADNYDAGRGTSRTLKGTRAIIDPDGAIKMRSTFGCEKGCGTGLTIELAEPVPVNYKDGRYQQVYTQPDWRPSESWEVTINNQPHEINIFRMIMGLTVTTSTSRPEKGTDEILPINNLDLTVRVALPTWEGVENAEVGLGHIYIPKSEEVVGTPWGPPIKIELLGLEQRGSLAELIGLGVSFNKKPYIAPYSPGVTLFGDVVSKADSPIGAPDAVDLQFSWSAIKPGVTGYKVPAQTRVEISEAIQIIVVFMAARPLYVAAEEGGAETATGGNIPPPIVCAPWEDPLYNKNDELIGCQVKDLLGDLKHLMLLVVVFVIVVAFMYVVSYKLILRGGKR